MIALAPLRGWAGEVMALQMATQQLAAAVSEPVAGPRASAELPYSGGKSAVLHGDCLGHPDVEGAATLAAEGSPDDHAATHCPTCSACQSCSLSGLAEHARSRSEMQFSHGVPTFVGTAFTSAAPALGLKPPIS